MQSITDVTAAGARQAPPAAGARGPEKPGSAGEKAGEPVQRRERDRYAPREPEQPTGRYRLERDQEGRPKVYFDGPEREEEPDKAEGRGTVNTDQVDREVERLKQQEQELARRLDAEGDPARARKLERELEQTRRELQEKDNDAYRRQHAQYTSF